MAREPQALLQQIARGIKAHDVQQPVPWELLQLVLQFAREEKGGGSLPDWAAALGFESLQLPPQQPTITNAQREQLSGSISQELSLCRLQVNQRSREEYQQWLSNSSAGSLKPLFKCLRKYEASVERPFPSFSAASKLLLRLQQWSALWCSSGTAPAPALKNSASEPVLKPGSSQLLAEHALRGTLVRPHSRPPGRMAGLRS